MSEIDVSIFIRSRNEAALIGTCLRAISEQKHSYSMEVIVLDSESTDGTATLAREFGAKVFSIPKHLFTYSSALNAGANLARGRFLVCLSAHCVPASPHWLEQLLHPLQDTTCGATYSRQIPWPDVSIPEALQINRAFPDKPKVSSPETWKFSLAERKEPFVSSFHSNTSSAYRLEVVKKFPFRKIPFAEDRLLAGELLNAGFSVHYAHTSIAYHSHYPSFQEFRSVARLATISRRIINSTFDSQRGRTTKGTYLISQLKIPVYIVLLSILVFIPLFPGRKSRLRELHWRISSIGTTLGKSEGIYALLHEDWNKTSLEEDSPQKILRHLEDTGQLSATSHDNK